MNNWWVFMLKINMNIHQLNTNNPIKQEQFIYTCLHYAGHLKQREQSKLRLSESRVKLA